MSLTDNLTPSKPPIDKRINNSPPHMKLNKDERHLWIVLYLEETGGSTLLDKESIAKFCNVTGARVSEGKQFQCPALRSDLKEMENLRYIKKSYVKFHPKTNALINGILWVLGDNFTMIKSLAGNKQESSIEMPSLFG